MLANALLQLLLPRACASCESSLADHERGIVCGTCWTRVPLLRHPRCDRCGHPRPSRGRCPVCPLLAPFVRSARSVCWVPDDVSSAIVGALKYDGWPSVATEMSERMARVAWPPDVTRERAAVVPVPLAAAKQRARGFNQAELLADAVAARWGIPAWTHVLSRTRATPSQTSLTPGERLANVHRAFTCTNGASELVAGHHLILVDDVFTTGATLNACASALFDAGARTLSYLTFGRARTDADRR